MSVKRKRVGQDEAAYDEGDSVPMPLPKQSCNPRDDDLQDDLLDQLSEAALLQLTRRCQQAVARRCYPKRIILIRHGQSQGNVDADIYAYTPDPYLKLTDTGRKQAEDAGRKLKELIGMESAAIVCSPFVRAQQTAELVCAQLGRDNVPIAQDPRLREQEFGMFQKRGNMKTAMRERRTFGAFYYRFENGESGADVFERVSQFIESLHQAMYRGSWDFGGSERDFPENLVIVSHGLTMRLFLTSFFRLTVDQFHSMWNPRNCERFVLSRNPDGGYLIDHPIKSGGVFPPLPCKLFRHGLSTTVGSTWGVTAAQVNELFSKFAGSEQNSSLSLGSAHRFLEALVDLSKPRLIELGCYPSDVDVSSWPEQLFKLYFFDSSGVEGVEVDLDAPALVRSSTYAHGLSLDRKNLYRVVAAAREYLPPEVVSPPRLVRDHRSN
eukprot:m.162499 g.162499  ORF g.162499 m.162499 type:complete len:437 (-) comp17666_c0_seq2:293-1603(-)